MLGAGHKESKYWKINMTKSQERKVINVCRDEFDVLERFADKTIEESIKILEELSVKMSDYSFLAGCNVKFERNWEDCLTIDVTRLETDDEYNMRQKRNRIAAKKRQAKKDARILESERRKKVRLEQKTKKELKLYKELKAKYEPPKS